MVLICPRFVTLFACTLAHYLNSQKKYKGFPIYYDSTRRHLSLLIILTILSNYSKFRIKEQGGGGGRFQKWLFLQNFNNYIWNSGIYVTAFMSLREKTCKLFGKAQIHGDKTSQSDVPYVDNVYAKIKQS